MGCVTTGASPSPVVPAGFREVRRRHPLARTEVPVIRLIMASLLATAAVVAAGCGRPSAPVDTPSVAPSPLPSGTPSKAASMVCADEAQHEISLSLQLQLDRPVTPTW